ncbi:MAG: hypothetical protein ACXVA9_07450 [Bdellovibrionales bacterium]
MRGHFIITLLSSILFWHFAFADSWTGVSQPLEGPATECSIPPADIQDSDTNAQVVSEFTYLSCRQYRSAKSKAVYYVVENAREGEYIHMIPPPGQTVINPFDYKFNAQAVYQTCLKIREGIVNYALPLKLSRCATP